jgi:fumarate reductase subunit C
MVSNNMIRPYLEDGEKLLWSGKPAYTPFLDKENRIVTIVKYSLWIVASAICFYLSISSQIRTGVANSPVLYICFIAVPVLFMLVPVFDYLRLKGKTYYGITDKRIVIVNGKKDYPSRNIDTLDGVQTRNNEDGSATLCFGKAACEAPSFSLRTAGVYGISDGVTGDERGLVFYHVNDYENALKQIPQK